MPKDVNYCPKCDVKMDEVTILGVAIDQCRSCSGVWLDSGELKQITKGRPENVHDFVLLEAKKTAFLCPKCRVELEEGQHEKKTDLTLDRCPSREGLFADRGEFQTLLERDS